MITDKISNTDNASIDDQRVLPVVYTWEREGSFLDQIRDVWKCYYNNSKHHCAIIVVDTINQCMITILDETHKSMRGVDKAKAYCESVLNNR